jgi:hypothetical protein
MKSKTIFRSAVSFIAVLAICLMVAFTPKESQEAGTPVLTLTHITLNGTYAYAFNGVNNYTGTVNGGRTTFAGMPAGNYNISICGNWKGTNYSYQTYGFYYNGGDQGNSITINPGFCND